MGMRSSKTPSLRCAVMLLVLFLTGCHQSTRAPPLNAKQEVDGARLLNAENDTANWIMDGRTYSAQRYSPLDQINERTVRRLGLAWYHDLNTFRGVEATPLAVDGVLYNISAWNIVTAFDARTGKVLWTFDPKVP